MQQLPSAKGSVCSKEPDGAWTAVFQTLTPIRPWPTVILEVSLSESLRKLGMDTAWWIANSQGKVNLVIIISINEHIPEITY